MHMNMNILTHAMSSPESWLESVSSSAFSSPISRHQDSSASAAADDVSPGLQVRQLLASCFMEDKSLSSPKSRMRDDSSLQAESNLLDGSADARRGARALLFLRMPSLLQLGNPARLHSHGKCYHHPPLRHFSRHPPPMQNSALILQKALPTLSSVSSKLDRTQK
jgi:hypothetical protein